MRIAVITPALETRIGFLRQAMESVQKQTLAPVTHCVVFDYQREGLSATRNRAVRAVPDVEWLAFLDDDDLFDKDHLETLAAASGDADIVYSDYQTIGLPRSCKRPIGPFDLSRLRAGNYIPATALVSRELFDRLGGFRSNVALEDWDFWLRAAELGARFRFVNKKTWSYRLHGDQLTWQARKSLKLLAVRYLPIQPVAHGAYHCYMALKRICRINPDDKPLI